MTTTARCVLQDLKAELESALTNPPNDQSEWRRSIVTLFALLRAVGHVLEKVDAEREPHKAPHIRAEWRRIQHAKPRIFSEFIEQERNNILKQYVFPSVRSGTGQNVSSVTTGKPGGGSYTRHVGRAVEFLRIDLIQSGHYQGREILDVVAEGIQFWQEHLDNIDNAAGG